MLWYWIIGIQVLCLLLMNMWKTELRNTLSKHKATTYCCTGSNLHKQPSSTDTKGTVPEA